MEPKFDLGGVCATPSALRWLSPDEIADALNRHVRGDWGECCAADKEGNELALRKGYRLLSIYRSKSGIPFWIMTEAERWKTTVLLPRSY